MRSGSAFCSLFLALALLALAASTRAAAGAQAVRREPLYEAWRQALERAKQVAMDPEAPDCGASDALPAVALAAHQARVQLLDALAAQDVAPMPAPAGVAPWPFSPLFPFGPPFPSANADFDTLDTAVVFDDGRIIFRNGRGAPEVDPYLAAQRFYALHEDEYDFLLLFTNFPSDLFDGGFLSYHLAVSNDISGLGYRHLESGDVFDLRHLFSRRHEPGALQSFLHLNDLHRYPQDPKAPYWRSYTAVAFMAHELAHRWSARLRLWDPSLGTHTRLLGKERVHWSFFANADGSVVEGSAWVPLGEQWATDPPTHTFGPLDLYLMGMLHPNEIPPGSLFYLDDVSDCAPPLDTNGRPWSAGSPPLENVLCSATRVPFTMENIYRANGVRRPVYPATQQHLRVATMLVARAGTTVTAEDFARLRTYRTALAEFFTTNTLQRGSLDFTLRSVPASLVFRHRPHGNVEPGNTLVEIHADIDLIQRSVPTSLDDVSASVFFSVDGGAWTEVRMVRDANDTFRAVLPVGTSAGQVRYYLYAESFPGFVTYWPADASRDPEVHHFAFQVTPDLEPPTLLHTALRAYSVHAEPIRFRALVRDAHNLDAVWAEYGVTGGLRQTVALEAQGLSDLYEARVDLPGQVGETVEYRIVARDGARTPHTSSSPGSGWHSLQLTRELFEDVESDDANWTHMSLTSEAPDEWHREVLNTTPSGYWCWKAGPERQTSPSAGSMALGQDAVLITPAMRLSADWEFSFFHKHYLRRNPPGGDPSAVDGAIVEWQDAGNPEHVRNDRWFLIDPVGGYNDWLGIYAIDNPLQGYQCWSGRLEPWTRVAFNRGVTFHNFENRLIRFRLRVAVTPWIWREAPAAGWYVDDLLLDPGSPQTPVTFSELRATRNEGAVQLDWRATDLDAGHRFRVERARASRLEDFVPLAEIAADVTQSAYRYRDTQAAAEHDYLYRVGLLEDGVVVQLHEIVVPGAAFRFRLEPGRPNPFNPQTEIRYELPERGVARLFIYDVQGRRVRALVDSEQAAGLHTLRWDGTDDTGRQVASGVYVLRLNGGRQSASQRLLVVR